MDGDYRRISVYDVTGLRVHPNGYRVHQTEHNSELGRYMQNVQSTRGWIADDAGGSIGIPKYRRQKSIVSSEFQSIEAEQSGEGGGDLQEDEPDEECGSDKGKRKKKPNNMGPIKRRRFTEDDNYLSIHSPPNPGLADLGLPSQDLLKNIHYAAAKYYDERGLLVNASKRYRKERRLRRLHSESALAEGVSKETPDGQSVETTESEPINAAASEQHRKFSRDMYKVLSGSILIAMGVLTQEVVKKLVVSRRRSQHVKPLSPFNGEAGGAGGREGNPTEIYGDEEDMAAMH